MQILHGGSKMLLATLMCLSLLQAATADYDWDDFTVLDEYVGRDDGYFEYTLMDTIRYENFSTTVYVFNMTSQKWMDEVFVDRPVWYHDVGVAIPDEVLYPETCFMLIDGGSNNPDNTPDEDHLANIGIAAVAGEYKGLAGYVRQVPNQPLYFMNDPEYRRRTEDDIIAWSWKSLYDWYMMNDEYVPEVALRMPMTKAAKRAMDLVQEFIPSQIDQEVEQFYFTGASKRGWTTWSIAATDQRVTAIAPLVFSLLNFEETLMAHYQAMDAGWSFALRPYYEVNLTMLLTDDFAPLLFELEDMWHYRSRLTLPKLLVSGTADEFFLCQDSHYWWDDMPGTMRFLMCPNADHSLFPCWLRLAETIMAFFMSTLHDEPIPDVEWEWEENEEGGYIEMKTDPPPELEDDGETYKVRGLRAVTLQNDTRRDYRLFAGYPDPEPHRVWWVTEDSVEYLGDGLFRYESAMFEGEWVGYFIEAEWEGPNNRRMFYTTEVHIIPDTFPAEPCEGMECYGELV